MEIVAAAEVYFLGIYAKPGDRVKNIHQRHIGQKRLCTKNSMHVERVEVWFYSIWAKSVSIIAGLPQLA